MEQHVIEVKSQVNHVAVYVEPPLLIVVNTALAGPRGPNGTDGENGEQGLSAYQVAVNNGFEGTEEEWLESLRGGNGEDGEPGMSAYQIALNNGFVGTEEDWLASLEGAPGPPGEDGESGEAGPPGPNITDEDVEVTDYTKGLILRTSDGTRARITLQKDSGGNLELQITQL